MLKNSANGILAPTMIALRRSPRKTHWMKKISKQPKTQVVHHRAGGHGDERRAVVIGHELDPRRQRAVVVDLLDLGSNARHHVVGVQRAVHDDDGGDDIVLVVAAGLAEARHVADGNLGDVFDKDRHAVRLAERRRSRYPRLCSLA